MKCKVYIFSLLLFCQTSFAITLNNKVSCLETAYKPYVSKTTRNRDGKIYFHMENGQKILWQDKPKKTFEEKLVASSLADMLSQPYPAYQKIQSPHFNQDPGRFRNTSFFQSVYGSAPSEVKKHLVKIRWLPNTTKQMHTKPIYLLFDSRNGAARALQKVSGSLDQLPMSLKKYVLNPAGTFKWRMIAGTNRYSVHSFGIAIDINTKYSNYWRWDYKSNLQQSHFQYHNKIPAKIVSIFEQNKFIWGGRWYHYDTMHFEYRPEFFGC